MKKHPFAGIVLLLLLSTAGAFAQETPATAKGTWAPFIETTGLSVDTVGVKYFLQDKLAFGSGFTFTYSNPNGPTSSVGFGLSPFLEFSMAQKGPFSLNLGPFIGLNVNSTSNSGTDITTTVTGLRFGGLVGLDWFFLPNVSLGARYRAYLLLDTTRTSVGGSATSTTDTTINLLPYGEFLLTFYFK